MYQQYQQQQQPKFQQFSVGSGIDNKEYNCIISSAINAYMSNNYPMSTATSANIKKMIGGEWFVFVCDVNYKEFDFYLSCVTGGDFMGFSLNNTMFQICRLRD